MALIEFRRATRRYDPAPPALDGLDLVVPDGERLAVLGPSGSGKSTLLRLAAGLDRPTSGGVWFDGEAVDEVPPHLRDVGMVFQEPALQPFLDVAGNLEFGMRARGVPRDERRRRVAEVADMLGLAGLLRRRPSALSGGERQRAAIGRAVARRPRVLLLDEPFSSLDLPLRAALRCDLIDLHDRFRMTMVHVTHDQGEALAVGRLVAVLDRGRLAQVGGPREVYDRPASPFVARFVGDPPMNLVPGEVVELAGGTSRFMPDAGGLGFVVAGRVGGGRALAGVRPEHVRLGPDPGGATFQASIRRIEYRGDATVLTLDATGGPIVARVGEAFDGREGDVVVASLDLAHASWFPG